MKTPLRMPKVGSKWRRVGDPANPVYTVTGFSSQSRDIVRMERPDENGSTWRRAVYWKDDHSSWVPVS